MKIYILEFFIAHEGVDKSYYFTDGEMAYDFKNKLVARGDHVPDGWWQVTEVETLTKAPESLDFLNN